MPEWSPETVSATWLDRAGLPRVGARFEGTNRHGRRTWKTVCTVTACEPGRVFAFRVKAGPLPIAEWSYTFEPVEHTTVVIESWTDRRNALASRGVRGGFCFELASRTWSGDGSAAWSRLGA